MIRDFTSVGSRVLLAVCCGCLGADARVYGQSPNPVLNSVFPAGGQAGTSVIVALEGTSLEGMRDIHSTVPRLTAKKLDANRLQLDIPAGTPSGIYDLRAVGLHGVSSPRAFFVSNRTETLEVEPNDTLDAAQEIPLDAVANGRIDKPGDVDCFKFKAKAGQRVVMECWGERIDSRLRAVLEVYDADGKRLASNRGYARIDPLVDFLVPADGTYSVKVFDLSFLGSTSHFYRLDIDTKPRVEFAYPCVLTRGKATKVKLYGRNLSPGPPRQDLALDSVEVEITPPMTERLKFAPLPIRPSQLAVDSFTYSYPGSNAPVLIGVTDLPVIAASDNRTADRAQEVTVPCAVNARLIEGDERHWYAVHARKGEVLWLEAFGARLGAPVDLDVTVLESTGKKELLKLAATVENLGGYRFPTDHPDPTGRWVVPADGRYLILVRNVIGGTTSDARRLYWLSIRREEADFDLAIVSRRTDQPAGLNVMLGGREMLEVFAFRHRGMSGPIRITAENLPSGIQCPDAWIGPGQDRGVVVLSASRESQGVVSDLKFVGHADVGGETITRSAKGGSMIWPKLTTPSGRLTQAIPLATAPESRLLMTASPSDAAIDQEGILDVAVDIEQRIEGAIGPIQLSVVGLPRACNSTATIPAGKTKGWVSIAFPTSLPPGPYTFAIQAETTIAVSGAKGAKPAQVAVNLVSNPITVTVRPARIVLELDPHAPTKIARGKIVQLRFTAERKHGFIGKVHTELTAPGGVVGLRARGVTLVGQSDSGSLQVIATDDAPLGRHLFLRLEAVGTVEDRPVYRACCFVELEITE